MAYADITFADRNCVKRWLQWRRLDCALALGRLHAGTIATAWDFGAGNGELCKRLAVAHPATRIICHEPAPQLLAQARDNLAGVPGIEFSSVAPGRYAGVVDVVFCLEVFEHLPPPETAQALQAIRDLLRPGGLLVVGVPVEVGVPALYKGCFRMVRRWGAFDARPVNILSAFAGCPPRPRPVSQIADGMRFHFAHMGFDHRVFRRVLGQAFAVRSVRASPFAWLGSRLMPEVYFVAQKGP